MITRGGPQSGAIFSNDEKYRYVLWRHWNTHRAPMVVIMLNPSTATEMVLDPTVRRCVDFAKRENFGGLRVFNMFALRATNPEELTQNRDPIGRHNDESLNAEACYIRTISTRYVVVAWGAHPMVRQREERILQLFHDVPIKCFGLTHRGHPKHPLYLPSDQLILPYP